MSDSNVFVSRLGTLVRVVIIVVIYVSITFMAIVYIHLMIAIKCP